MIVQGHGSNRRLDLEIKFKDQQRKAQIKWRKDNVSTKEFGIQNGRVYEHVIPQRVWEENLWIGIRTELKEYLVEKEVQAHTGIICWNSRFTIPRSLINSCLIHCFVSRVLKCKI